MQNFDVIMKRVHSFYTRPKSDYVDLKENHSKVIKSLLWFWIDKEMQSPKEGQKVLAIQDMRFIDKGAFVGEYYFENGVFVANQGDTDPYGHITFWIAADTLNNLDFSELNYIGYRH